MRPEVKTKSAFSIRLISKSCSMGCMEPRSSVNEEYAASNDISSRRYIDQLPCWRSQYAIAKVYFITSWSLIPKRPIRSLRFLFFINWWMSDFFEASSHDYAYNVSICAKCHDFEGEGCRCFKHIEGNWQEILISIPAPYHHRWAHCRCLSVVLSLFLIYENFLTCKLIRNAIFYPTFALRSVHLCRPLFKVPWLQFIFRTSLRFFRQTSLAAFTGLPSLLYYKNHFHLANFMADISLPHQAMRHLYPFL